MRRIAAVIVISLCLSSCSSVVEDAKHSTQATFQQFLAKQFAKRLEKAIDSVIEQLATKGGYLDDPLVKILLPPPLGLVIGIARELQNDPQAALVEILINQAAENTIPLAGPILKNIVSTMSTPSLEEVMTAGNLAATAYLQEKSGAMMQEVLLPAVSKELHINGAIELYGKLVDAKERVDDIPTTVEEIKQLPEKMEDKVTALQNVTPEQLRNYVAEQAISGLFKKVAEKEILIRTTGGGF